ncbi:MAG: hypothetical protein JKY30_12015, partial [Flavobacteriales bacterium]|nr:hypothetical protein [Flavobacteriales bacterium]
MKKTILYLIIVFVGLSPLSLNAQLNNVENEEKIDVSKYMTSKSLNIEVKEFFIKQIRETKLVKDIDNHEFVHFFLDRYDHQYKKMIKSKFIDETVLLKSVAKIKVGNIIEMLASDFNQYKIVNPNVHKNYNNGV